MGLCIMCIFKLIIKEKSLAITYSPTNAVPSAQLGLTSVFGMGTGVAQVLSSLDKYSNQYTK